MYKDQNDDYRGSRYPRGDRYQRGDRFSRSDRAPRGDRYQGDDRYSSEEHSSSDEIYSCPVKAGKRTYFFDVKATKDNSDFYLTITESKRRVERDGRFSYDKHKIFLYKEDFEKFAAGLQDAVNYIKTNCLNGTPDTSYEQQHEDSAQQPAEEYEDAPQEEEKPEDDESEGVPGQF